ncbi:MAG: 23S rRNA (adenine(2503)-C(2))-methyltransferase RlmN [Saprospiraceae bacterium]
MRNLSQDQLIQIFAAWGEPSYRAKQVFDWLWNKSARSFDEMSNLSKSIREKLEADFQFQSIILDHSQHSNDGTIKSRFELYDQTKIESVLIPVADDKRFTVCVSTQVGCSLTCKFCATGKMGRIRNLDAGEIYDQVVEVNKQCLEKFGHPLTNIVYMGMGEPLLNYASTMKSIDLITSPDGLGMSAKRITVSTAGIAKMIRKLADDGTRVNLALSLHAPTDVKRNEIMPINESNSLDVLMDSLAYFHQTTGNRITYEYLALQGFNDTMEDAIALEQLCVRFPVKVNIIEYNSIGDGLFEKSDGNQVDRFAKYLSNKGVQVTVRRSRGKDIDAACGQLANK